LGREVEEELLGLVPEILRVSDTYEALKREVKVKDDTIMVGSTCIKASKPLVIAVGKASIRMAQWALDFLKPVRLIVITPKGTEAKLKDAELIYASHPVPDKGSVEAGSRVVEAINALNYDSVILLLSGGASSLMELPEVPFEDLVSTYRTLINSGLPIWQINALRKHLSKLKGGKLASMTHKPFITLAVSDVPGNELSAVGSGPGVPDPTTFREAYIAVKGLRLPYSVMKLLERGIKGEVPETPKSLQNSFGFIILDNMRVLKHLSGLLRNPLILTSEISGESREVGRALASIFNSCVDYGIPVTRPFSIIMGGEPEVTVRGKGKGGRNSELALSFSLRVRRGINYGLLAFATDGVDGNSEYAGVVISNEVDPGDPTEYFERSDTYSFFEKVGRVIKTGPTQTNVNNVYVAVSP